MILALTPNPALDLTYEVDSIAAFAEHRVRRVHAAPGGTGVNVARVLAQLGRGALCAGPLGGRSDGDRIDLPTSSNMALPSPNSEAGRHPRHASVLLTIPSSSTQ